MDLSKINYINSAKYLPPELQKNEYYLKQCSLIDSLLSSNSEYFKYERNQLQAAMNKYKDYQNLDESTIHQIVKEFGFQYIIDVLDLPESKMKNVIAYLSLINMLKGTKNGLELVLTLLGLDFKALEWWEDPITLPERNTYALELVFTDMGFDAKFLEDFKTFSRQYVYPLLNKIVVYFKFNWAAIYTGCAFDIRPTIKLYPGESPQIVMPSSVINP